ncbi:squalene epoxidase-domain-containing protein [Suillus lakei]|nr:squalene epoxidase-domain-containing protein [Suillus lakei]
MLSSYDVLIVGAGVAGPALAYALATKTCNKRDAPLRIALLERSLSKPDRIVAELLQPGGVAALRKLGLESCLEELGSVSLLGYHVLRGEQGICAPFPEGHDARAFEHGEFIMALRDRARRAPNIDMIETAVTGLIEDESTHRVIAGGQPESHFADLVILADGSLSKFRTAVLGHMPYEPSQRGYLAGLIVKDLKLAGAQYAAPILNALETSRVRRVPHYYLPPTKQGEYSKAGAFLLGDSLNMRHPLTAGGMTVALNDVVILSDLLANIESFGNWNEISVVLRKWHHMRKPLASTINTMSMSWAGIFAAEGEAFDIMQEGAFKFFGKGAEYSKEPMSLAAGITHSPLLLARSSLAIAFYSIWVLFTHPRPGKKSAPQFYEYPLLLVKALNVIWTIGIVMGPVMWAEM